MLLLALELYAAQLVLCTVLYVMYCAADLDTAVSDVQYVM